MLLCKTTISHYYYNCYNKDAALILLLLFQSLLHYCKCDHRHSSLPSLSRKMEGKVKSCWKLVFAGWKLQEYYSKCQVWRFQSFYCTQASVVNVFCMRTRALTPKISWTHDTVVLCLRALQSIFFAFFVRTFMLHLDMLVSSCCIFFVEFKMTNNHLVSSETMGLLVFYLSGIHCT